MVIATGGGGVPPSIPTIKLVATMEKACPAELYPDAVSVAVMLKLYVPVAVGPIKPLIVPVDAFNTRPGGSAPEETDQCRVVGLPPIAEKVKAYWLPAVPSASVAGTT